MLQFQQPYTFLLPVEMFTRYKLAYFLAVIWPLVSIAQNIVLPGKAIISPDKFRSIKLINCDREYHYAITDNKTGKVTVLDDEYNPVFAIVWSSDSRSIFAVEHVAKGVVVQVLHFANNRWNKYTIDVPEQQNHESTVVGWNIRPNLLTLVCKVTLQKENGANFECHKATFDVDPSTGKTSNLKTEPLTFGEYRKLKSKFDPG